MRNNRRNSYQENKIKKLTRMIEELESEIKELRNDNRVLEEQNGLLKALNEEYKSNTQELDTNLKSVLDRCQKNLDKSYDLKIEYEELIEETEQMQRDYRNKMEVLLKRLRKQCRE